MDSPLQTYVAYVMQGLNVLSMPQEDYPSAEHLQKFEQNSPELETYFDSKVQRRLAQVQSLLKLENEFLLEQEELNINYSQLDYYKVLASLITKLGKNEQKLKQFLTILEDANVDIVFPQIQYFKGIKSELAETLVLQLIKKPSIQLMQSFTDLKWLNASQYDEVQLSKRDLDFISNMVKHELLAQAIKRLNQIGNENLDDETHEKHMKDILDNLANKKIIYVNFINVAGITTFRGNFVLHKNLKYKKEETALERFRRLLVITHEAFGRSKRIKYSHQHNVLLDTPEDAEISKKFSGLKQEAGNYVELSVFGTLVTHQTFQENPLFAEAVCEESNWLNSYNFSELIINPQFDCQDGYNNNFWRSENSSHISRFVDYLPNCIYSEVKRR